MYFIRCEARREQLLARHECKVLRAVFKSESQSIAGNRVSWKCKQFHASKWMPSFSLIFLLPLRRLERLYVQISDNQWPIVYDEGYNIKFFGIEKLHPFDSSKWATIFNILRERRIVTYDSVVRPLEPTEVSTKAYFESISEPSRNMPTARCVTMQEELEQVHSKKYLKKLKSSCIIAGILEMPLLVAFPNEVVQRRTLLPLRLQTGGTVAATNLALQRGWAINIGVSLL